MKTIGPYTPIQYIMGRTGFFGLDLAVNEDVLIPRPETEILVQTAMDLFHSIHDTQYTIRILDLCTGSGNIAIALTKNIPDCKIVASDISVNALEVARMNLRMFGLLDRVELIESDLFDRIEGKFDMIVSNPPYIARYEFVDLPKDVLKEPRIALYGGEDGLDFYRRIFAKAGRYLDKGGYLAVEIGYGQARSILKIIKDAKEFKVLGIKKDQNDIDRVIIARKINQDTPGVSWSPSQHYG